MHTYSLSQLKERAKELQCLYDIEELLQKKEQTIGEIFHKVLQIVPLGYQLPGVCFCQIKFENSNYSLSDFIETKWSQSADIIVDNSIKGHINVFYSENLTGAEKPFLAEEQKLLNTIAERIGYYIFQKKIKKTLQILSDNKFNNNQSSSVDNDKDAHWKWRLKMASNIAEITDFEYYGVKAMYIIGSTKNCTSGPASDIDLLIHFDGTDYQKDLLESWIHGWSYSLAEMNWQKTGYKIDDGIIDLHIITDKDINNNDSFAIMIKSSENSARLLKEK